jgi:hypothetical protein
VTAVDEEPRIGSRRGSDAPKRPLAGRWMTTIQGADPDGEHQVERLVDRLEGEVFSGAQPHLHATRGDLLGRGGPGLDNGPLRTVDSHNTPGEEAPGDRASRRAGPAADLEDVKVRLQGKGVHDDGETRRQGGGHVSEAMRARLGRTLTARGSDPSVRRSDAVIARGAAPGSRTPPRG